MKYEIAITGASRPKLYKIMWESFHEKVKMKERPKITAYEDVIFQKASAEVGKFLKGKVDNYVEFNPFKRLGYVKNELLNNLTCEYFLYLQDDWKFLKEIDMDLLIDIMDNNPDIKQIWFPKKLEPTFFEGFCEDNKKIDDTWFVPYKSWAFLPNISRTDFVRDIWKAGETWKHPRPESPFKKALKGKGFSEKIISYAIGKQHNEYIEHLGLPSDYKGKPGTGIEYDQRTKVMIERRNNGYKK